MGEGAGTGMALYDLERRPRVILARCACGRTTIIDVGGLARLFEERRWSRQWEEVPRRLRCDQAASGCGRREPQLTRDPRALRFRGLTLPVRAPKGMDVVEWARADDRERKRMIVQLRS